MYVTEAHAVDNWIIVRTLDAQVKTEDYWLINKSLGSKLKGCRPDSMDGLVARHVYGPFTKITLQNQLQERSIRHKL